MLLYEQISSTEVDTPNGRGVSEDLQYLDKGIKHLSYVSFLPLMGGHEHEQSLPMSEGAVIKC